MSDQQIELYRGTAIRFIENNASDLMQLYLTHRKNEEGVLGINLTDIDTTRKIDVAYLPLNILPEELVNNINERKEANDINIIYFLLITPFEEKIIELDIRTLNSISSSISPSISPSILPSIPPSNISN